MNFPENVKYTMEHEWVLVENGIATIGITDFAQNELGDIIFLDIETVDQFLNKDEVFGSVEAVKVVSDLFMPISGKIIEKNPLLDSKPELVNNDSFGDGWLIKVEVSEYNEIDDLLDSEQYRKLVGC